MKFIFLLLTLLSVETLQSQTVKTINSSDFQQSLGAWTGTITYLDYSSGKPFTMPANVTLFKTANPNEIILALVYPKEPKANGNDTLHIGKNGSELEGAVVVSKKTLADGSVEIVTEKNGVDGNDNRKAILRHTYLLGKTKFSNRKDVKFDGEDKWVMRNEYLFAR